MSPEVLSLAGGAFLALVVYLVLRRGDETLTTRANDAIAAFEELKTCWDSPNHQELERLMIRTDVTVSYLKRCLESKR